MKARIYHNPRCSKSRAALALLRDRGVETEVIEYLTTPPTQATLERLLRELGTSALALVRTDEPEFRPYRDRSLGDAEVLALLALHPRLLQRPIVEVDGRACIGRPPERVLALLA
jgi:arsenate reductase